MANKYRFTFVFALALICLLIPNIAHAAPKAGIEDIIADIAATVVKYLSMFIWIFLAFIGKLMNNEYLFQPQMTEMLRTIWMVVRNLVNVGFAIILVGASFYLVIFGGGEGGINIKSALPRFVLGLILVNFSWLGCRVILDTSSILTSAVFAIPQSVAIQKAGCSISFPKTVPKKVNGKTVKSIEWIKETGKCYDLTEINFNPKASGNTPEFTVDETKKAEGEITMKYGDFASMTYKQVEAKQFGASNAAMILAVNLGMIQNLVMISKDLKGDKSNFTINTIFSLILILAIAIPIVALFIVLIARMVILWLCIAFMPLAFLGLVLKGNLTTALVEKMPDIVDQFIKNAFLPVYVAAPLSVGFLMINTAQTLTINPLTTNTGTKFVISPLIAGQAGNVAPGTQGDLEAILWYLATVGIIWMGTFAALEGNKITDGIVKGIQNKAQDFGKFVATSPKYLPFVPIYLGKKGKDEATVYSLESLMRLPGLVKRGIEDKYTKRSHQLAKDLGIPVEASEGAASAANVAALKKHLSGNTEAKQYLKRFNEHMKRGEITNARKELKNLINKTPGRTKDIESMTRNEIRDLLSRAIDDKTIIARMKSIDNENKGLLDPYGKTKEDKGTDDKGKTTDTQKVEYTKVATKSDDNNNIEVNLKLDGTEVKISASITKIQNGELDETTIKNIKKIKKTAEQGTLIKKMVDAAEVSDNEKEEVIKKLRTKVGLKNE